ncbi:hypothetical protein [Vibrio algivorus]|uniref:Phage abortive infection protein n=1 Tax=Vibrio algivorus TaxID=1667024 RepID=A0A557P6E8_9VIBR|nr:hypothetical protein [Vibrio algivorus]TVO36209.1 hypothetical protein FOF44_09870 [Vibrio algivorus]
MFNRFSITATFLTLIVIGSYVIQFYFNLGYNLSSNASDWVEFSDYTGGLINPILSFMSLILLIKSLNLQNKANNDLRLEIKLNQKHELLRSFETYFFGLIEAQRVAFSTFKLDFPKKNGDKSLNGVCAIQELEDQIEIIRRSNGTNLDISEFIELIDKDERIYSSIRIFYNIVKMISERLSNSNGFNSISRKNQYQTLINFTEFSQFRLVLLSMQFIDCPPAKYLNSNSEFISVLRELGIEGELY